MRLLLKTTTHITWDCNWYLQIRLLLRQEYINIIWSTAQILTLINNRGMSILTLTNNRGMSTISILTLTNNRGMFTPLTLLGQEYINIIWSTAQILTLTNNRGMSTPLTFHKGENQPPLKFFERGIKSPYCYMGTLTQALTHCESLSSEWLIKQ